MLPFQDFFSFFFKAPPTFLCPHTTVFSLSFYCESLKGVSVSRLLVPGQTEVPGHHPQLHGGPRHRARHQQRAPARLREEPRHPERTGPAVPAAGNQGEPAGTGKDPTEPELLTKDVKFHCYKSERRRR